MGGARMHCVLTNPSRGQNLLVPWCWERIVHRLFTTVFALPNWTSIAPLTVPCGPRISLEILGADFTGGARLAPAFIRIVSRSPHRRCAAITKRGAS